VKFVENAKINGIKIGTFREWLIEYEGKELNEVFEYTPNYKEISKDEFLEYEKKIINKDDPEAYKKGLNLESENERNHGPRVHYYLYKDFVIIFGKLRCSKKYEVHFWNIKTLRFESLGEGDGNYSSVFSAAMSIVKDKHFDKGKLNNVYIKHKEKLKIDFYKKIITKMLKKYNLEWYIHFDKKGLYLSKDENIISEREFMVLKGIMSEEQRKVLDNIDYKLKD